MWFLGLFMKLNNRLLWCVSGLVFLGVLFIVLKT